MDLNFSYFVANYSLQEHFVQKNQNVKPSSGKWIPIMVTAIETAPLAEEDYNNFLSNKISDQVQ